MAYKGRWLLTSEIISKKRRARHVAADEAHAWARTLDLRNPNAKSVLRAMALYVDGEGYCFVGLDQLSADTDLSPDTVRRRLVWLEQIGAIARVPQWIDAAGVRNSDARGKRTTDKIRLMVHASADDIEQRAQGHVSADESDISSTETTSISPSREQGLNPGVEGVGPAPALAQPSQCCDPLISEPEPESSPQPPSGGVSDQVRDEVFEEFVKAWGEPIPKMAATRLAWDRKPPDKRPTAVSAAKGYWFWRKAQTRPPAAVSAQSFIRDDAGWEQWLRYAPRADGSAPSISTSYRLGTVEANAIIVAFELGNADSAVHGFMRSGGAISYRGPMTPQLLAMAQFAGPKSEWKYTLRRNQAAAWEEFLSGVIMQTRTRLREGDRAPYPWRPNKDGSLPPEAARAPPGVAVETLMSDADASEDWN